MKELRQAAVFSSGKFGCLRAQERKHDRFPKSLGRSARRRGEFRALKMALWILVFHGQASAQTLGTYAQDFLEATLTTETLLAPAASAAWSNYVTQPSGFPEGATGLGQHYGVALADNVSGKFLRNFVFAAASHRRDEYEPHPELSVSHRIGRAALHSLFASDRVSVGTFNWSSIPTSFASAGISNAYQPKEQRTWQATLERTGTNSLGYLAGDMVLEFSKTVTRTHPKLRAVNKTR